MSDSDGFFSTICALAARPKAAGLAGCVGCMDDCDGASDEGQKAEANGFFA